MYQLNLFNRLYIEHAPISGVIEPRDINYIKKLYTFNKDSIEDYYQSRNFVVKNTNILSRILGNFPTYIGYDNYQYLEFANDKIKYLAKHFKFTSEIEKGIVHPGYFFGNGNEEIILAAYEDFDLRRCISNWKKEKCVYVLKHNRNDTKMLLPLGTEDGSRTGICSLMVNIPKLAIKYREFVKDQIVHSNTDGIVLNKNHFVIKYVLSTMVEDTLDHCMLNKIMDKFYGREEVTPKFKHRFKIFEPNVQLDRYIDNTLDIITTKKLDYVNLLNSIKLPFNDSALTLLSLPDLSMTRQIKWSLLCSRIDYMLFAYDVAPQSVSMNRHFINDWKRLALRFERDNNIEGYFSYQEETVFKEKLYKLKNL